ncbi:MAG TPA: methyltransferase domain-containing protein, partial [Solirubrobacterales bacterium]
RDMKDMQRAWALKAVLGRAPRGSRLLEIGAGEPVVAALLSRLGYDVTVVDPYDGSDGGPREYEEYRRDYPDLELLRERFPPPSGLVQPGFAAIYSISVLEHLREEEVGPLMEAIGELLGPDGISIHAVDHVLAGWGADAHAARLRRIAAAAGIADADLETAVARLGTDPEAYLVSAEAHEGWRGDLPYDDYPMRRIGSVQLVTGPPRSAAPPA